MKYGFTLGLKELLLKSISQFIKKEKQTTNKENEKEKEKEKENKPMLGLT